MPASCKARSTPMCAQPRAEPPPSAKPILQSFIRAPAVLTTDRASAFFAPPVDHSGQGLSEPYDSRVKSRLPRVPAADIAGWLGRGTAQRQKKLKRAAKRDRKSVV